MKYIDDMIYIHCIQLNTCLKVIIARILVTKELIKTLLSKLAFARAVIVLEGKGQNS